MGLNEKRPTKEDLRPHHKPLGATRAYEKKGGRLVPKPYLAVTDAQRIGKAIERRFRKAQRRKGNG